MSEWKIKDVCKVLNGRAYSLPELLPSGKYRVLRVGNFFNSDRWYYSDMELARDKYCEDGDLLFAWSCSFGPKIWHGEKTIYHYHIWKIVENEELIDRRWLYYWLLNAVGRLTAGNHGSVMLHMTKGEMEDMPITVPSLPTQRKIAAVLGALDDKIELNRKMNANLEAMAQALFKSWFVDFEPFGGHMPEGWRVRPMSDLADFIGGYAYTSSELQPSRCAMATIKNFERNGGFKLEGYKEIVPSSKLKESQRVDLFDVLVAHTDLTQNADVVGNVEMILSKSGYESLIMSTDLVKVLPKEGVSRFVLAGALKYAGFKAHALGYVNGTTVLHMSKKALPEYGLPYPDDVSVLKPLAEASESICQKIAINQDQSRTLAQLRDTLLPKLMSGELDVDDVKID